MPLTDTRNPAFPRDVERPSPRRYVRYTVLATAGWIAAAWFLAESYVDRQVRKDLAEAEQVLALEIADIASGVERNLSVFRGLPSVLARDPTVRRSLAAVRSEPKPADLETRRAEWTRHPLLAELNAALGGAVLDIRALSALWVVDPSGDCIAASNSRTPESFVGISYADRAYFKSAMDGVWGRQFAVGRATRVPGLFFSAPVEDAGRVVGLVAAKVDIGYLSSWVNLTNAYITDSYGVVVLAQNRMMEMLAFPWATVERLDPAQRRDRYHQENFGRIALNRWGEPAGADLYRLEDGNLPLLVRTQSLQDTDLAVTVMHPVPRAASRQRDTRELFAAAAAFGGLCLATGSGVLYYVVNRQRERRYREYQAQLEFMASHDALTGLFSRTVIDALVGQGILQAARSGRNLAVLFLDMDLFKDINDSMGHESGDLVLQEVARRLRGVVRASDPVVRHGGDEFVVLLNEIDSADTAAWLAGKILDAVHMPLVVQGVTLTLTASIGIALYPQDGDTPSLLLRNADSALYRAKAAGRSDYCFYHGSMNADAMARLALHNELREAIDKGQFVLHYQPQYSLAQRRVVGCEALVRWQHPVRGLLAPGEFITVAEKTQLIVALGEWVLREACRQASAWRTEGLIDFPVAVNLSAVQFRKPGLAAVIERALADSGLPPGGLELELTESVLVEESGNVIHALNTLKKLGVNLAIDDFGTGYSNLAYLKRFEPDMLKIDASFVRDLESDPNDVGIVRAIVGLAASLGYRVVAEGVEKDSQRAMLEDLGCHEIQGFLFSRPLPAGEFAAFVLRQGMECARRMP